MDLSIVTQGLASLAFLGISAAIPIMIPKVIQTLKIKDDGTLAANLDMAAKAAAGQVYMMMAQKSIGPNTASLLQSEELAKVAANVVAAFPDTLTRFGKTAADVETMISGRLGTLMAADPTVSATGAVTTVSVAGAATPEINVSQGMPLASSAHV